MADVSVIIAAYNAQNTILRAVQSALNQNNVSVEVIVVDDASTDNAMALLNGFDKSHVKIIQRKNNGGPGLARNDGIDAATSPWIAILDGDDEFAPERLARLLNLGGSNNADILVDNLKVYDDVTGVAHPMFTAKYFGNRATLDLATFIKGNASFLGGTSLGYVKPVFSTGFLQKHSLRYHTHLPIGEDYLLMADCLASGAICVIDQNCGYHYTVHHNSTSHRITHEDLKLISISDREFMRRHKLTPPELAAQAKRTAGLQQAIAFTKTIDALKQSMYGEAFMQMLHSPSVIWNMKRPLCAIINKVVKSNRQ